MPFLDMVRSMMSYSGLPLFFWGYALDTTMYILNHVCSKPWVRRKPNLCIWRCPAHVLKEKMNKSESKSKGCFVIGYLKETKGQLFNNPKNEKVFVRANVVNFMIFECNMSRISSSYDFRMTRNFRGVFCNMFLTFLQSFKIFRVRLMHQMVKQYLFGLCFVNHQATSELFCKWH